jgi:hypothetical protein
MTASAAYLRTPQMQQPAAEPVIKLAKKVKEAKATLAHTRLKRAAGKRALP